MSEKSWQWLAEKFGFPALLVVILLVRDWQVTQPLVQAVDRLSVVVQELQRSVGSPGFSKP